MSLQGKNVAIVGLGMMGGAIADALKKQDPKYIAAFDINEGATRF